MTAVSNLKNFNRHFQSSNGCNSANLEFRTNVDKREITTEKKKLTYRNLVLKIGVAIYKKQV